MPNNTGPKSVLRRRMWASTQGVPAESWDDLTVLRDITARMLNPLVHEGPPPEMERCPDCHVPLHNGKERHYVRRFDPVRVRTVVFKTHRAHTRCTAKTPIMVDCLPRAEPLPTLPKDLR